MAAIARELCMGTDTPVEGDLQAVARAVGEAIQTDFQTEEQINAEAERTLDELGSSATGMDRGKLLAGIRARIAQQRGFVL